jgi:hypothetical protein
MEIRHVQQRELVVVAVAIVGLSSLIEGPLVWAVAGLLLGAVVVGSLQALGEGEPLGVPVEALILPGLAALASVGAIRLVPPGLALVPALAAAGLLVRWTLRIEGDRLDRPAGPTPDDRTLVLVASTLVSFLGFTGVAALVPGGLAQAVVSEPGGGVPPPALSEANLLLLAGLDGAIAFLLGYRTTALRATHLVDALWSATTYGAAIAIAAAAIRAMAIPQLLGPALLTLVFFLWDAVHGTPPRRRRDARFLWQTALLAALGVVVVAWNLGLRT